MSGAAPAAPILSLTAEQAIAVSRDWFHQTSIQPLRETILRQVIAWCAADAGAIVKFQQEGTATVALSGEDAQALATPGKTGALWTPDRLTIPLVRDGAAIGEIRLRGHALAAPLPPPQERVLELLAAQAEIALSVAHLHIRLAEEADRAARTQTALRTARVELARNGHWAALAEFSANLAHEINQPLAGIALHAAATRRWLDRDPPMVAEAVHGLREIASATERAADIVRALKLLTRPEPTSFFPLPLNALVQEVRDILDTEVEQSGVTVAFTPAADDPVVMGNEVQLQQVVMNLVINALEALADNAPGNRNLRIGVSRHDGCARITVSDNGPGIRPDLADTLFAPLVTSRKTGMGMGLAICRSIVATHKGTIAVASTDDGGPGCRFVVDLPMLAAGRPDPGHPPAPPPPG